MAGVYKRCITSLFLLLSWLTSSWTMLVSINFDLSEETAYIGDDVTLTCVVQTNDSPRDDWMVIWGKRLGDRTLEIGTNAFVNPPFSNTDRYRAWIASEDTSTEPNGAMASFTMVLKLTIIGVRPEDSGQLGCLIPSQSLEDFKEFSVFKPIESVQLRIYDQNGAAIESADNGQNVVCTEGDVRGFYCLVDGSYPEAKVTIRVGDQDVTEFFTTSEELLVNGPPTGLQVMTYETTSQANLTMVYDFNEKTLICETSLVGSGFPVIRRSADITLNAFSPKFSCPSSVQAKLHTRNVALTCRVRANPEVTDTYFHWQGHAGLVVLNTGSSMGHQSAELQAGKDDLEKVMVLRTDRVFLQHFRRYVFVASNALGTTSHEIWLEESPKTYIRI